MDFHQLWMRSGEASLPYIMRGAWLKSRVVVSFLIGQDPTPYHHNGLELMQGAILVNPLGAEFYRRSTGTRCGSMSLSVDDLAATGLAVVGKELTAPDVTQMIRPPPHLMRRLLVLYETAETLAKDVPDLIAHSEIARALEQELMRAMVHCLAEGASLGTDHSRNHRVPVMRRFEQFLGENRDLPLYMTDICAAIGVSERTLRLHCAERIGVSPHRYLWLRRMHQVQRALTIADPADVTVTEVAMNHGFWELGRFSVAYRRLFGQSPSATLKQTAQSNPSGPFKQRLMHQKSDPEPRTVDFITRGVPAWG
jgi:AraC-like DNA-binding protein